MSQLLVSSSLWAHSLVGCGVQSGKPVQGAQLLGYDHLHAARGIRGDKEPKERGIPTHLHLPLDGSYQDSGTPAWHGSCPSIALTDQPPGTKCCQKPHCTPTIRPPERTPASLPLPRPHQAGFPQHLEERSGHDPAHHCSENSLCPLVCSGKRTGIRRKAGICSELLGNRSREE